jgi:hypothetical protein
MRCLLLFILLAAVQSVTVLNMDNCRDSIFGPMEFKVCEKLKEYEKFYFEDATGMNQVTLLRDRLYRNKNYYTAYSTDSQIFIGKRLYKNEDWFKFRESFQ